jgi:epoxide hydrolase-like predicted phosphatase
MGILSRDEAARYMAELLDVEPEELLQEQDEGEVQNTELITFIATLKGKYQLGLLSNINGRERLGIRFEPGQLDTLFNTVVASGDEGYVKPQPEIYHIVATRLGVQPEECVMIDDIAEFCDGARAVGMQAIQFVTTRQCIQDLQAVIDRGE